MSTRLIAPMTAAIVLACIAAADAQDLFPDGPGMDILRTKCRNCHMPDRVTNVGGRNVEGWQMLVNTMMNRGAPVTEDELQGLYECAAVYVYPAPEEDFGMGVIESMAKGVPVVAWNQAGPTLTVAPNTGYLAEPLEVGDYAAGITRLLDDRVENQATGERAFAWARRFDWERHLDVLERAVLEVARLHEQFAAEAATA